MSNSDTQSEALIQQTASSQPAVQQRRSSSNTKVIAFTLVACFLIASQAVVGYFLITQRNQLNTLEAETNSMKYELLKRRSDSVRSQKQMHFSASAGAMASIADAEGFLKAQEEKLKNSKSSSPQPTDCQKEASGEKPVEVPGFRPVCDEEGLYRDWQCFENNCWCVDPKTGSPIHGPLFHGPVNCSTAA